MIAWNPEQYLRFGSERTRPSRDLASAVPLEAPGTILDAGCGPGNSTAVLKEFWPHARIQGVDASEEMLGAARRAFPVRISMGILARWEALTWCFLMPCSSGWPTRDRVCPACLP